MAFTYLSSVEKGQALKNELAAFGIKAKGFRSVPLTSKPPRNWSML